MLGSNRYSNGLYGDDSINPLPLFVLDLNNGTLMSQVNVSQAIRVSDFARSKISETQYYFGKWPNYKNSFAVVDGNNASTHAVNVPLTKSTSQHYLTSFTPSGVSASSHFSQV